MAKGDVVIERRSLQWDCVYIHAHHTQFTEKAEVVTK